MRPGLAAAILLSVGIPAFPHRLDEYLQATIISLEQNRLEVFMRLIPGVAVSSAVLGSIQKDKEGGISGIEQRAYAEQVVRDLSISVDGTRLVPRLRSVNFPSIEAIKEGVGEIQIELSADMPPARNRQRKLVWENHHESRISAYLVNCLMPQNREIRIVSQKRNENQSLYQLNYIQNAAGSFTPSSHRFAENPEWPDAFVFSALLGLAIVSGKQFVNAVAQTHAEP